MTAYQSNYRFYRKPFDADFSPLDAITIINNYGKNWNHVNVITQKLKFSSSRDITHPLKWTAGTYFFHQYSPVKQTARFGEEALLAGLPDKNFSLISTTISKSTGLAVYGQGAYMVSGKLNIIAGLRYVIERKKQSVFGEYQKDPDTNPAFAFRKRI